MSFADLARRTFRRAVSSRPVSTRNKTKLAVTLLEDRSVPATVGVTVFYDGNGDHIQDAGENYAVGVGVNLFGNGQNVPGTTDANGYAPFAGVSPGSYSVAVSAPAGYTAELANGSTNPFDVGTDDVSVGFGLEGGAGGGTGSASATIDVYVFYDGNGNGELDGPEQFAAGIGLTLSASGGAPITRTTDSNGYYQFTGLAPGTYTVDVSAPSGYTVQVANGFSNPVTIVSSTDALGVGFGLESGSGSESGSGAINGTAFFDGNGNQTQDAGEAVAVGVQVTATLTGGAQRTTYTDSNGNYSFTGLASGSYLVSITPLYGYTIDTPAGGSTNVSVDNDTVGVGVGLASSSGSSTGSQTATLDYDTPWESADSDLASQSLPVSNFSLSLAGQTFTSANASFTTSPTVQLSYGTETAVSFAIDTSAIPGYPYSSLSMNGEGSLTAIDAVTHLPVNVTVVDKKVQIVLDFTPVQLNKAYNIQLKLFNAPGGAGQQVGQTELVKVTANATVNIIRGLMQTHLQNLGLTAEFPKGNNNLMVITGPAAGANAFGTLNYQTFANGKVNYAGPKYGSGSAGVDFYVNGKQLNK